jgi:hypothetical protein
MSVFDVIVDKSIRPRDESLGAGAKVIGPVCEGRPPRTLLEITVSKEVYAEPDERLFSTSRTMTIG